VLFVYNWYYGPISGVKDDKLQIKIKVEVNSALSETRQQQPAPLDKRKITLFGLACLCLGIAIFYLLWPLKATVVATNVEPITSSENATSNVTIKPVVVLDAVPDIQQKLLTPEQVIDEKSGVTAVQLATPSQGIKRSVGVVTSRAAKQSTVSEQLIGEEIEVNAAQSSAALSSSTHAVDDVTSAPAKQSIAPEQVIGEEIEVSAAQSSATVKRAILTTAIVQREPVDDLTDTVSLTQRQRIFYFTHLLASNGQVMQHRWYFKDTLQASVRLKIGSDNWRTYSSKAFTNAMQGSWRVELVDSRNKVLDVHNFDVSH